MRRQSASASVQAPFLPLLYYTKSRFDFTDFGASKIALKICPIFLSVDNLARLMAQSKQAHSRRTEIVLKADWMAQAAFGQVPAGPSQLTGGIGMNHFEGRPGAMPTGGWR